MNTERIINIILTDLSLENLKLQEDLEKVINDTDNTNSKLIRVKQALKELTINEIMINKFQNIVSPTNNNNNINLNQNG